MIEERAKGPHACGPFALSPVLGRWYNKTMSKKQYIILIVACVAIGLWALLTWLLFKSPSTPPSLSEIIAQSQTSTNSTTASSSSGATPSVKNTGDLEKVVPPSTVSAPSSNAPWVFGTTNTIQWNRAANITGGIYLEDAANGKIVGWILEQAGPQQTSFPWDTRDVFLSRSSPLKQDISAGSYVIKVMFDSPEDPTITSQPFSIIYPNQVQIPTYTVGITNGVFSPGTLSVKRGDKVVFNNYDPVNYSIVNSSFSPFSIQAGSSYTFDTAPLSSGPYVLYSESIPTLRMTVTVQ